MKNTSIKGIKTAGLIGYIVCILLIVISIVSMVTVGICTAGAFAISKESVNVSVQTNIDIDATGNILTTLNRFMGIKGVDNLEDLVTEEGQTIDLDDDTDLSEISVAKTENGLAINTKTEEKTFTAKKIIVALISTFVLLGAVTVTLEFLKNLMKSIKDCETPFCEPVIKNMSRFAISLIPAVFLNMVCGGMWTSLSSGSGFAMTVNLGSVLLVAVIFLLIAVFKYGAQLQQESDETL